MSWSWIRSPPPSQRQESCGQDEADQEPGEARLTVGGKLLFEHVVPAHEAGDVPAYRIARVMRLGRVEVDAFIDRSRVRPGELDHLYPAGHQGAARRSLDA